ncbi:MAG: 3-deoxy-D-manno-octulosonic acid transferase [Candidatus Omnitrophica bacterium]|nr:3-deoxy-D-manno-octulosonic acid transferase [Candidatus Omnitrophota bacterium]
MWILYEVLLFIGLLLYIPKAVWRGRLPHRGWTMRLGRYPEAVRRPLASGGAVWVHAVSVGEVIAAQPLIRLMLEEARRPPLVLSTVTPAGFEVASKLMGDDGAAMFAPFDFRATVSRALRLIRPRLLVLVESELWPTLIRLARQEGVPVVVVNGRVSERAFRRYLKVRRWMVPLLAQVDRFFMQTDADAERITRMGAPPSRVHVLGSLKWDASLMSRPDLAALQQAASTLGVKEDNPLIVAGSTHRGEEAALLEAFARIRGQQPRAKLILAPRHVERTGELEELLRGRGLRGGRVSSLAGGAEWDVALVDTMGQLPLYYGLASVVFVGGSLIPHGGQNPIEPASLGKPVVFGPSMENFAEIVQQLLAHQAARQLRDASELTPALQALLDSREDASLMGARAQALVERLGGTSRRTLDALHGVLDTPSSTT